MKHVTHRIANLPAELFLLTIGVLLFFPFLGSVHLFDWDEINFAESAREMLLMHNYRLVQINFEPFYEKPPLFIWLQAVSMKIFGVNEFAARLPNAVCGIATLLAVFNAGRFLFKWQFGILWAMLFACSILPHIYFKSGIIDPVFNLFIFAGIFFLFRVTVFNDFESRKEQKRKRFTFLLLSAFFIGLATLTKGPVAILLTLLTGGVYFFINRGKLKIELGQVMIWFIALSSVILAWLGFGIREDGMKFVNEFITYQIRLFSTEDAGHGGFIFYHFVVLLIGVFPASALIFESFSKNEYDDDTQQSFKRWMIYLLCIVLIVFTIVRTKIIHYSSLCYFPLTFLAAYYLHYLIEGKKNWNWRQTLPLLTIAIIIVTVLSGGIIVMQHPDVFINFIKDDFAKECLKAEVLWSKNEILYGIVYLVLIIAGIFLIHRKHIIRGVSLLIISSIIFISALMILIVPRVEKYSQSALIEFMISKQNENCIVETAGFKSYAQYFYCLRPLPAPDDSLRKVYTVTKINKLKEVLIANESLTEMYRKNGWVFLEKEKK